MPSKCPHPSLRCVLSLLLVVAHLVVVPLNVYAGPADTTPAALPEPEPDPGPAPEPGLAPESEPAPDPAAQVDAQASEMDAAVEGLEATLLRLQAQVAGVPVSEPAPKAPPDEVTTTDPEVPTEPPPAPAPTATPEAPTVATVEVLTSAP